MPEINGYKAVPIRLSPDAANTHTVYMREHFIRQVDSNKPKGRTLFLLNVPPYVDEASLKSCFTKIGPITSIQFATKPGRESKTYSESCLFALNSTPYNFKVAFIVFKDSTSISKALKLSSIDLFDKSNNSLVLSGIDKWKRDYERSILDEATTQQQIDKYMQKYDVREQNMLESEKNSAADNDGWITVGKQGRNAGFEQKESVINKLEDKMERSRKNKELKNFYTFQIRESKMQNVISLRKKFEEDKNKIEILKKRRRFKPF